MYIQSVQYRTYGTDRRYNTAEYNTCNLEQHMQTACRRHTDNIHAEHARHSYHDKYNYNNPSNNQGTVLCVLSV